MISRRRESRFLVWQLLTEMLRDGTPVKGFDCGGGDRVQIWVGMKIVQNQ